MNYHLIDALQRDIIVQFDSQWIISYPMYTQKEHEQASFDDHFLVYQRL